MVIDGKRTSAQDWSMGPGWVDDDVQIGKEYPVKEYSDLSPTEWKRYWNSDDEKKNAVPYGNFLVEEQRGRWKKFRKEMMHTIPACHAADEINKIDEEHGHPYRRAVRGAGEITPFFTFPC
jgi:hypothetical protein